MQDVHKSKARLIAELLEARARIAELKGSGADHRAAEPQPDHFFELSSNPLCVADLKTMSLSRVNPAFASAFGYEADHLLGRPFTHFVHPEDLVPTRAVVMRLFAGEAVSGFEIRCLRGDGAAIWLRWTATPVPGTGLVYASAQDITDRKRTEEALRQKEALITSIMDNLPIGVAVNSVSPDVTFQYMNDNFPRFYRTTREALSVRNGFWDAVYEDAAFRTEIRKRVLADCASNDPDRLFWQDVPIARKGQETTYVTARNIPIPDKKLMLSTVWDVTERKKAEEAMAASLREKETLLREIHHRVKNNLQIVSSLLSLQEQGVKNPKARQALAESGMKVMSMAMIHEQLYRTGNLSGIDMGRYLPELLSRLVSSLTGSRRIGVRVDVPSVSLCLDQAIPLGLIMNELVTNSLKHAFREGGQGSIVVAAFVENNRFEILAEDDGKGLPDDFDLDHAATLGLQIVRMLADQLHGWISFESGPGTSVRLAFPLQHQCRPA